MLEILSHKCQRAWACARRIVSRYSALGMSPSPMDLKGFQHKLTNGGLEQASDLLEQSGAWAPADLLTYVTILEPCNFQQSQEF